MSDKDNKSNFSLHAWGGAGTVTGANFELRTPKSRILVDCGLIQGTMEMEALNKNPFPYESKVFSALLVTHAHMDHLGRIPKLVHDGFAGVIYSTAATRAIAEIVLRDAENLEYNKSKTESREPMYTRLDLEKSLSLWQTLPYHTETIITDDISVVAYDTGHILGGAMYWIMLKSGDTHTSLLASGDLGNSPSLLLPDLEIPPGPDYLLMESVYGDRNHEGVAERENNFKEAVWKRINNGGTVLIPAFSIERTQVILSLLNDMFNSGELRNIPVFLDSPLAIHVTEVYQKMSDLFNKGAIRGMAEGDGLFKFKTLQETARVEDSRTIQGVLGPKIIIAGSGMSTGGRVVSHEKRLLPDENVSVLLMGYQAPGTLGRLLEEGAKKVEIDREWVPVNAEVISIHGFSGHADSDHLLQFVENLTPKPKKVFLAMGEAKACNFLAQRIKDTLDIDVHALSLNESDEL